MAYPWFHVQQTGETPKEPPRKSTNVSDRQRRQEFTQFVTVYKELLLHRISSYELRVGQFSKWKKSWATYKDVTAYQTLTLLLLQLQMKIRKLNEDSDCTHFAFL